MGVRFGSGVVAFQGSGFRADVKVLDVSGLGLRVWVLGFQGCRAGKQQDEGLGLAFRSPGNVGI